VAGLGEEIPGRDAKGSSDFRDVGEGDVLLASFDRSDVGSVEAAARGELLLGPAPGGSECADMRAKPNEHV
jgi:hypothetical protein